MSAARGGRRAAFWMSLQIAGVALGVRAADPFAEGVRATDPLTPEEQRMTFSLPEGFEIQLVASEPDIQKPMNMAFDAQGRLWLTDSTEYPFPGPLDKPTRDTVKILEDFDASGRARKITTFADGLNIPIGLHPQGNGVIVWSIPNIWRLEDTDGDGKADKREVLYGPLGWERDTHGNQASFRRGFDGWLYITHGFNNNSTVQGRDGSQIQMNSGNTYRVRIDGSRVEQHTWGQVNPFGMCFDPFGNMYTADCHSAPIYELLRGAYYPSFGKPHDGLGFGPAMIEHSHGSTAISGIVYYSDNQWPGEFRDNIFIGNVMTSRVNRDRLEFHGSTKKAVEQPDFLTTTDPWFRPVDLQLGPDGALYVADFYNRIIGHYEVPLMHPGRDRHRGRIWRVVYKGATPPKAFNLASAKLPELLAEFASANPTRRMLALNSLVDRHGSGASKAVADLLNGGLAHPSQWALGIWALHRVGGLTEPLLALAASHEDALVRAHAMKVLGEMAEWSEPRRKLAAAGLRDSNPSVQRAAAESIGLHPAASQIGPILAAAEATPAVDVQLAHALKISLRNQLREPGVLETLSAGSLPPPARALVAEVLLAVATPGSASFLLDHLRSLPKGTQPPAAMVRHVARHLDAERAAELRDFARSQFGGDPLGQHTLFKPVYDGAARRGGELPAALREWGERLAVELLDLADRREFPWSTRGYPGAKESRSPWFAQQRLSEDGDKDSWFLCSLPPGGEQLTGTIRSDVFDAPPTLTFFIAGHDGFPDQPPKGRNLVCLVDAKSGEVLRAAEAPRHDTARKVSWDLADARGRTLYLEAMDGDDGEAYAWLALGRITPPVARIPQGGILTPGAIQVAAAELVRDLRPGAVKPRLAAMALGGRVDAEAVGAVAEALRAYGVEDAAQGLATLATDSAAPFDLRETALMRLAGDGRVAQVEALEALGAVAPSRTQTRLAQALSGSPGGAVVLLNLVERGKLGGGVLGDQTVAGKLKALQDEALRARAEALAAKWAPPDAAVAQMIQERVAAFSKAVVDAGAGRRVFEQSCAVCHQLGGVGNLVGPQLDGLGNRGLERVMEDILDPNRNVDSAFRAQLFVLKDGDVVSGLPRREEGELLILADSAGKEISIRRADIDKSRESEISLMPANFGDVLPPADLANLVSYLLQQTGRK